MLAQVKPDQEIFNTLGEELSDRLARMRNWINGPHFPEELRSRVLETPMQGLDLNITASLREALSESLWNSKDIGDSISSCFKVNAINPREGYRNLYLAILGVEKGPRLAPILAELNKDKVLKLLGE